MNKKIDIMATLKDGIAIAGLNFLSLILVTLLYVITIWIPYLNVGTTIAMASLPAELAKGNMINPLFIFEGKYRKNMGEFFILMALMSGAIGVGFMFMGIPGIVIAIAWNFAAVLFVDKDMPALDALRESNRITYGNKWRIFGPSSSSPSRWVSLSLSSALSSASVMSAGSRLSARSSMSSSLSLSYPLSMVWTLLSIAN